MVGKTIGIVHEETINRRCVVAQRYLRFKVDIDSTEPLPAGFFQGTSEGDDIWIQFKYERLSDYYFNCGQIDHITGRCTFREAAKVTTATGVSQSCTVRGTGQNTTETYSSSTHRKREMKLGNRTWPGTKVQKEKTT